MRSMKESKSNKIKRSIISFFNRKKICQKPNIDTYDKNSDGAIISEMVLQPKMRLSTGTLIEIERWVKKAKVGKTKYAFGPIMKEIESNRDVFHDATHAMTLAQIMPYQKMIRYLPNFNRSCSENYSFVASLSKKYRTTIENVVERMYHVKQINKYFVEQQNLNEIAPFKN